MIDKIGGTLEIVVKKIGSEIMSDLDFRIVAYCGASSLIFLRVKCNTGNNIHSSVCYRIKQDSAYEVVSIEADVNNVKYYTYCYYEKQQKLISSFIHSFKSSTFESSWVPVTMLGRWSKMFLPIKRGRK
jgi:hypothetical protein